MSSTVAGRWDLLVTSQELLHQTAQLCLSLHSKMTEGCASFTPAHGAPTRVQGKDVSGQEQMRETLLTIPTSACGTWGGQRSIRWRIDAESRAG